VRKTACLDEDGFNRRSEFAFYVLGIICEPKDRGNKIMRVIETVNEALELKVDMVIDVLPNPEETGGQKQYEDLLTLLAELEAEGFFAELDSVIFTHDKLLSAPEEVDCREQYEDLFTLLTELEADGFFREQVTATLDQPKATWSLQNHVDKLIQPMAAIRAKAIACFDSNSTLTAKMSCTLS
jgi:hypothetical protein